MMISDTQLTALWPHASATLVAAVTSASEAVFAKYAINTKLRVEHFMAQCSHESGGGTITAENLNYTHAERLMAVWPGRFKTLEFAQEFVGQPEKLASYVYNGRMGNRPGTDDGWRYRGKGLIQITGRGEYEALSDITGLDLLGNPDLAFGPATCLDVAGAFWHSKPCNEAADADNLQRVTRFVNGGQIGLPERRGWLLKWKAALA